jgi:hypothetical protein
MGVLLASHHRSTERSRSLLSLKDLLLVAFFVGIGDSGALTLTAVWLGLALLVLIPVQAALHVGLLRAFLCTKPGSAAVSVRLPTPRSRPPRATNSSGGRRHRMQLDSSGSTDVIARRRAPPGPALDLLGPR